MTSTPYDRQTSFALYSAENPGEPHSGATLDAEFNAVKVALDDTQQNLDLITDDDGALARGSVGRAQLDASITIGFGAPSQWESGVLYTAEVDTVFHDSKFYIASVTHTSGVSFDAGNWEEIADFTLAAVIADGSITSAKLAPGAVTADKIADGSISNTKLATGAVSNNKLAADAVTAVKIADSNVTTSKIADSNVTTAKLADDAVTFAKMQDISAFKFIGNHSGSVATPMEIGIGSALEFLAGNVNLSAARRTLPTKQVFTSGSGTYTTPANCLWIRVRLVGGGGGGGGSGSSGAGTGGTGGDSTFGPFTANGGAGGTGGSSSQNLGGVGGLASGGTINQRGATGALVNSLGVGTTATGGIGGNSAFFNGSAINPQSPVSNSGAGGGGASFASTAAAASGGGGGGGCEGVITSPAATYSYAVGAGGTAGVAGTSGGAGIAGAAGQIIVEEFYN